MASSATASADWVNSSRSFALAWGIPTLALIAGSFASEPLRAMIWSAALAWMGTACLINARRCGRTHCRYTGPFYLLLIIPVVMLGFGVISLGAYGWWILGAIILLGGKVIWWATEKAWGKYVNESG